jgi:hypothetical protein
VPPERPEAWSVIVIVQVLVWGAGAIGTVGVKLIASVCEAPRLSKYSTLTGSGVPAEPACVSVAGRLALSVTVLVGSAAKEARLICTGVRPAALSRGCGGIEPSRSAGQPSSTSPEGVRRKPFASGRNEPVAVSMNGASAGLPPTEAIPVTGSMPRPVMARSVGLVVEASAPLASMSQIAFVRTPPAVNQRPPPAVKGVRESLTVIEAKSTSARL